MTILSKAHGGPVNKQCHLTITQDEACGGSELKERVDGSANLLEEFMVSLYCSTASLPSLKVGCRTCVYLKGCRVGELSYLFV